MIQITQGSVFPASSINGRIRQALNHNLVHVSVATAALLILMVGIVLGWQAYRSYREAADLRRDIAAADALLAASDAQARERGLGALLLARPGAFWARQALDEARTEAEDRWAQAFRRTQWVMANRSNDQPHTDELRDLEAAYEKLRAARAELDELLGGTTDPPELQDWLTTANELNATAAGTHAVIILGSRLPPPLAYTSQVIKRTIWVASEHAGQNRAILAHYAAAGKPVPEEFMSILQSNRAVAEQAVQELLRLRSAPHLTTGLGAAIGQMATNLGTHCRQACDGMFAAAETGRYPKNARQWFEMATACIDAMLAVSQAASNTAREHLKDRIGRRFLWLAGYIVFGGAAGLLALLSLARVRGNARAYFRQKELAEVTLGSIGDAVITTDTDGRIEYINPIAEELTGWSAAESHGQPFREVFQLYNRMHASMTDPVSTCLAEGAVIGLTSGHVLIRRDGEEVPIEDSAAPIRDRRGDVVGAVVVFYDTERARQTDHLLSYHATRDALTGLVNRREFQHRLEAMLARAHATGKSHALAYIDLDQFKVVNDTCGHTAGDRMLRQITFLLQKRVRTSDTLARLGGDEFGMLLSDCTMDQARRMAEELRRMVQDFRFSWEGRVFQTSLSIGLVPIDSDSVSVAELLSEVDAACYAAKEKGRNRIQVYHPDDLELAQRQGEMHWLAHVREALEQDLLALYCQPIRALRPCLPPYVEITVRMRQADGEIISPMAFIPAAERYDLMPHVDRWMIRNACRQLTGRLERHPETIFTLNLSGTSLSEAQTADYIRQQAAIYGIPPQRLCLEITETAAIANLEVAIELMESLHGDGFSFALDDFGSGLSSLTYLKNLPVQMLKIDGAFVRNMLDDPLDLAMVQSFASIGHAIDIRTCAEFVENEALLTKLLHMNIDYAQGYAVAMPVPLTDYLQQQEAAVRAAPGDD